MKTALILGGTQFVGKRLVEILLNHGVEVTIATRGKTADPFGDKIERLVITREDRSSLETAFQDRMWDVVYDQTCYSSQEALDSLETLTGRVKRYIFTSSQAVYEYGTNHKEIEFDPTEYPITLKSRSEYVGMEGYREAKRGAEAVLFQQAHIPVVAVRFSMIVGEDDYTNRFQYYVDRIKNEESVGVPDPNLRHGFIHSKEAAQFLYDIGKSSYHGPINPGSKGDMSLGELIHRIETALHKKAIITSEGSPYAIPGSFSVNTERATDLGYTFTDMDKLISSLIHYFIKKE